MPTYKVIEVAQKMFRFEADSDFLLNLSRVKDDLYLLINQGCSAHL